MFSIHKTAHTDFKYFRMGLLSARIRDREINRGYNLLQNV